MSDDRPTDPWGWTVDKDGKPVPPSAAPASSANETSVAGEAGEAGMTSDAGGAEGSDGSGGGQTRRHGRGGWGSTRRLALLGTAGVVVLAGLGVGGYALASGGKAAAPPPHHDPARSAPTTTTRVVPVTRVVHHSPTCPLTGLPAPGGVVPQRPVLAVKVGNNPSARPQSGLEDADIVFDTLAEGGITRYIAVYQCGSAPSVGPVRSVRWDDWHILQMFGRADLAFVHGIDPDVNTVESLPWICDLDAFAHDNLYEQDPDRVAPDSTYTSTAALRGACPGGPAPPPIFQFAPAAPATATPVASLELPFSPDADVVWQWSAAQHAFLHFYRQDGGIVPDLDDQGKQLQATNVVIEVVTVSYGQYEESPGGTGDVESQTEGTGTAYVLRDGKLERGTWSRPTWTDVPTLTGADGKPMTLQPGQTWVEIVPSTDAVTITP